MTAFWPTWGIIRGVDPPSVVPVQINKSGSYKVNMTIILAMNPDFDQTPIIGEVIIKNREPIGFVPNQSDLPISDGDLDEWVEQVYKRVESIEPDDTFLVQDEAES